MSGCPNFTHLATMIHQLEEAKRQHNQIASREVGVSLSLHATTNRIPFVPLKEHVTARFPENEMDIIIHCLKQEYLRCTGNEMDY